MQFRWVLVVACALCLGAFVTVRAADEAKPGADSAKSDSGAKGGRLTQPWSKMSSLSDDQKDKIKAIHAKTLDEIKALHDKENTEVMALLSDDQKAEAKTLIEQSMANRKSRSADSAAAPAAASEEKKDETKKDEKKPE